MPGGKPNPFSMSHMLESLTDVVSSTRENYHTLRDKTGSKRDVLGGKVDRAEVRVKEGLRHLDGRVHVLGGKREDREDGEAREVGEDARGRWVDVKIQFIGATNLPKMDIGFGGSADPYLVATLSIPSSSTASAPGPDAAPSPNNPESSSSGKTGITFVSTVKPSTLNPVWNELWRVRNVPVDTELRVKVMDKDEGMMTDDYVGTARCLVGEATASGGDKSNNGKVYELPIEVMGIGGRERKRKRGVFWVKIETTPSTPMPLPSPSRDPSSNRNLPPNALPFLFDGPIRYSRHFSPTVGALTAAPSNSSSAAPPFPASTSPNSCPSLSAPQAPRATSDISTFSPRARLYSTWKLYLRGVPLFLRIPEDLQPWNREYKAAQSIFGSGPGSMAVRGGIVAGHRMLYARTGRNGFGVVGGGENGETEEGLNVNGGGGTGGGNVSSFLDLLRGGPITTSSTTSTTTPSVHRIRPAMYTYILSAEDDSFRFSETGAKFFVDFASKHALHACCATAVRYSGEFHVRPRAKAPVEGTADQHEQEEIGWGAYLDKGDSAWSDDSPDIEWELVIDNNSGTYSPSSALLPQLKALFEYNFAIAGRLSVVALDHGDETLKRSREACLAYARQWRGVGAGGNGKVDEKVGMEEEEKEESLADRVRRVGNVGSGGEDVGYGYEQGRGYEPTYVYAHGHEIVQEEGEEEIPPPVPEKDWKC